MWWPRRGISPRLAGRAKYRRDVAAALAHADALLAMAAVHRLALRAEQGHLLRRWALAMQGEAAAGVAHLRQALASPDVGPEALRPYWLATLAEAYGRAGQPQAGLQVLAEAAALAPARPAGSRPRPPGPALRLVHRRL